MIKLQLFVKNIPSSMSPTDVSKIFATYGKVHRFVQDPVRNQVVYVLMNSENAQKAINGLIINQITVHACLNIVKVSIIMSTIHKSVQENLIVIIKGNMPQKY